MGCHMEVVIGGLTDTELPHPRRALHVFLLLWEETSCFSCVYRLCIQDSSHLMFQEWAAKPEGVLMLFSAKEPQLTLYMATYRCKSATI